jgi:UDP-glucose 4-epimerase
MTHLITGGAGFIGSHLAKTLTELGETTVTVDNLSGGWEENTTGVFVEADLLTVNLDDLFEEHRPDYVWHLAAYAAEGLSHWVREFNYQNNVVASVRLTNAAVRHGVERFMFTSSMAVYGNQPPPFTETMRPTPEDPYGIAKHAVEQDLRVAGGLFGLESTVFRPHNVYGPNQNIGDPYRNVVGIFIRQGMLGEPLTVFGDGTQTRAFSHVSDIVRPMVDSLDVAPDLFNIGGEQVMTIGDLAGLVADIFGGDVVHLPSRYETKHAWCDHTHARRILGFDPTVPFTEGLDEMVDWARTAGVHRSRTPGIEVETGLPVFWRAHG